MSDDWGRDYGGYRAIAHEARALEQLNRDRLQACPMCGTPLALNLKGSMLNCPMGHFRVAAGEPGYKTK